MMCAILGVKLSITGKLNACSKSKLRDTIIRNETPIDGDLWPAIIMLNSWPLLENSSTSAYLVNNLFLTRGGARDQIIGADKDHPRKVQVLKIVKEIWR